MMNIRRKIAAAAFSAVILIASTVLTVSAAGNAADRKDISDCFGKSLSYALESYPDAVTQAGRCFTTHVLLGGVTWDNYQEVTMICNSETQIINNVQFHGNINGYNIYGIYGGTDLCDAVDLLFEKGYNLDSTNYYDGGGCEDCFVNEALNAVVNVRTDAGFKVTDVVMTPLNYWN